MYHCRQNTEAFAIPRIAVNKFGAHRVVSQSFGLHIQKGVGDVLALLKSMALL